MISIVIPVYNSSKYLQECIDSCLNQTYQDFEIILVDDGSTDSSANILDYNANRDNRIKYFRQNNAGSCSARNKAMENVSGEYVFFLDSDDSIYPNTLQLLIDAIRNADVAWGNVSICNEQLEIIDTQKKKNIDDNDLLVSWMHISPLCGTVLFRKSVLTYPWESKFESIDEYFYFVRNAFNIKSFVYVDELLLKYRNYFSVDRKTSTINNLNSSLINVFDEYKNLLITYNQLTPKRRFYIFYAYLLFLREKKLRASNTRLLEYSLFNLFNADVIGLILNIGLRDVVFRFIRFYFLPK